MVGSGSGGAEQTQEMVGSHSGGAYTSNNSLLALWLEVADETK